MRIARAWVVLMNRLGYTEFVAQGGDWGAAVTQTMGMQAATGAARHSLQHARHRPGRSRQGVRARRPAAAGSLRRGAARVRAAAQLLRQARGLRADHGDASADAVRTGGLTRRSRRRSCSTTATAPASPAWSKGPRRDLESDLTRDDLLDNITLYWLTNTGVSAARLYWENKADFFDAKPITIPFAISVFPDELYQAPRSWAERAYPHNLIHYNQLDRGGHFAAWEQPQLFAEEMRASFRSLRK